MHKPIEREPMEVVELTGGSLFRKKPIVVSAKQWFKVGDYPNVQNVEHTGKPTNCEHCGKDPNIHGRIETLEGGHLVCPGDWIIEGIKGELYPCKPDIFALTYEEVNEEVEVS